MEKDFRSLEHKIRDLMMETMARNSAKRMQVTNVARPDTAKDPTDVKSKIAKQGEIKTKIIDEENDPPVINDKKKKSDSDLDDKDPKKIAGDGDSKKITGRKTPVDLEPKTNDAPESQSVEDEKSKKARSKANKEIGAKGVKEETMTNKLTFGLPESLISAVREVVEAKKMSACPICGKSPCKCDSGGNKDKMKEEVEQVD